MNKYYHRGNGECISISKEFDHLSPREFNESWVAAKPITAYCSPKTPIGWVENCREQKQVWIRTHSGGDEGSGDWKGVTDNVYAHHFSIWPPMCRIFLVPEKEGEETKEGLCNAAPVGLTDTQGLLKAATPAVAVSGEGKDWDGTSMPFGFADYACRLLSKKGWQGFTTEEILDFANRAKAAPPAPLDEAAKEYFDEYTGGNTNVATWTRFAVIEFAVNFYKRWQSLKSSTPVSSEAVELLNWRDRNFVPVNGKWYWATGDNNAYPNEAIYTLFTQQKQ